MNKHFINRLVNFILIPMLVAFAFVLCAYGCQRVKTHEEYISNSDEPETIIKSVQWLNSTPCCDITREFLSDGTYEDIAIPRSTYPSWQKADSILGVNERTSFHWKEIARVQQNVKD